MIRNRGSRGTEAHSRFAAAGASDRSATRHGLPHGFTVVEVVLAVITLCVAVLLVATAALWAVRVGHVDDVASARTGALLASIESVRAAPYDALVDGSAAHGDYVVSWSVTPGIRSKLVEFVTRSAADSPADLGTERGARPGTATFRYRMYEHD